MKLDDIILILKELMNNKCIAMIGENNSICKKKGGCDGHCPYFIESQNKMFDFVAKHYTF